MDDAQRSGRLVGLATAGVAAYGIVLIAIHLGRMAVYPVDANRHTYYLAVIASAAYLPLMVWLMVSAARGGAGRGQWWALGAMALIVLGTLPVVGADWLGAVELLAGAVLAVVRPPLSILLFAVMVAATASLLLSFGDPAWAAYFTMGMLVVGPTLAVPVRLLAAIRELKAARHALAEEAVVRERLRIDAEISRTLGVALETIAVRCDQVLAVAATDPSAAAAGLGVMVDGARRTLADARRTVTRYRQTSGQAELAAAADLLTAAGIPARIVLPAEPELAVLPGPLRTALRAGTARLLTDSTVGHCVIAVTRLHGELRLEVRAEGPARAAIGVGET